MKFKKYQQISNIKFFIVFTAIGIVLVFADLVIKEPDHQIIMAQETIQGYRISPPLSLDEIKNVAESKIEWVATIPDEEKTRIIIQTAVTNSNSEEPGSWIAATNSGPIPGIQKGDDLTDKFLWTKQILENDDPIGTPSPQLHSLTEMIRMEARAEGDRISPEFDISGEGDIVKDSQIFWQADERFDGNINVKVNVFSDGERLYEQDVVNGGNIPGLEPGKSLTGAKIQTKTSFVGGPTFYPTLENIKIFIEIE